MRYLVHIPVGCRPTINDFEAMTSRQSLSCLIVKSQASLIGLTIYALRRKYIILTPHMHDVRVIIKQH